MMQILSKFLRCLQSKNN